MYHVEHFHFPNSPKEPRVGFEREGNANWREWERYLTIDGKKAFHIGNVCDTCQFLFSKLENANRTFSTSGISERLEKGSDLFNPEFLSTIGEILPADDYFVCRVRLKPQLVLPGDAQDYFSRECVALFGIDGYYGVPHNPKTPYYRDSGVVLSNKTLFINFVVPLHQPGTLDAERVSYYKKALKKQHSPTALAISVLDIEAPAVIDHSAPPETTEHWCLAHYLLDGHHKVHAAAEAGKECSLLCFISRKESFGGGDALYTLSEMAGFQG